jgi:CBS domain containing-hemolysin-like protein
MTGAIVATLIVAALILLNGLFVAAEFAIVGVSRPSIERRAARGERAARLVARILRDPRETDRFIATAQLGITVASLGLGMYGEHLLAGWLAGVFSGWGAGRWVAAHTLGSVIAIAILTYFHIVVGEMVPKTIALQRAERAVLLLAPVMRALELIAFPLIVALNGIGNGLLRLVGVDREAGHADQQRTPEDLAFLVQEARAGGLLRSDAAKVVSELLEFGNLTAGEVMVPRVRVAGIPVGATNGELHAALREHPFTRYPVYEGSLDRIVGMVHVKDLMRRPAERAGLTAAETREVPFIPTTAKMDQVMGAMRAARAQLAVVMDEHGGTAGIVTVEDLFEEVVGDVGDDVAHAQPIERDQSGLRVAGTMRLEDLGAELGVPVEHDDVDTVSGLVLALLGRTPAVGDRMEHGGVSLEVLAVAGRGVAEARVTTPGVPANHPRTV